MTSFGFYLIGALLTLLVNGLTEGFAEEATLVIGRVLFWPIYWVAQLGRCFWALVTHL